MKFKLDFPKISESNPDVNLDLLTQARALIDQSRRYKVSNVEFDLEQPFSRKLGKVERFGRGEARVNFIAHDQDD